MADKAISSLTEATSVGTSDKFVLEQSGQAKQISGATMISELAEALDGHGGIQSIDLVEGEGNVKTYRITYTDGTTYDYVVRDGESGNYAVVAGNLAPYSDASGATQSIPFLSQGTGRGNGSATASAGNYCQLKKKLGNTVGVNQLVPDASTHIVSSASSAWGNIGNFFFSLIAGHTYRIALIGKTVSNGYNGEVGGGKIRIRDVTESIVGNLENGTNYNGYYTASKTSNGTTLIQGYWAEGDTDAYLKISDLSLWYGSTDRIPSDLLSHPENWGRYYAGSLAYNAGTLDSADGTVMRSIGRNLFDKDTMTITDKYISDSNGNAYTQVGSICTDFIEVIPNTDYYIKSDATGGRWGAWYDRDKNFIRGIAGEANKTAPANARYIRFTIKYNNSGGGNKDTFCISLYYSGESGYDQYYPYSVLAEVDTGSEVLRSAGAVADEKTPDGTITRRVGVVDLGTLNYSYNTTSGVAPYMYAAIPGIYIPTSAETTTVSPNARCNRYTATKRTAVDFVDKTFTIDRATSTLAYVEIKDSAYTDAATFKSAMSGVYLYYELATPTTEQGTAFAENIPCNPVGSMSWENTHGIPQGAEIFYPFDYAGTLDSMIDALPSANGTYTLKATVANGKITYSWVAG